MTKTDQKELHGLLTTIRQQYGYDFRHYAQASMMRRIALVQEYFGLNSLQELHLELRKNSEVFEQFLRTMSVTVTDMFRNPPFYKELRTIVAPRLKSWFRPKIWSAGCATGEEVYSLAIMLQEENLIDYQLYATDFNRQSLATASEGIYPLNRLQGFSENYFAGGGRHSLADYYHARYNSAKMDGKLNKNTLFSHHNLVTDASFSEMQLIVCRNVLIYFNRVLQNRVMALFSESLCSGGFLCLGDRESIDFVEVRHQFEPVNRKLRIFRKKYVY